MDVLYEDNHLIVVKKEVGILSQADKTKDPDMLTLIKDYLKEKYHKPGNVFLGLVHRLDRMVGGVMVFAKTSKGASRLSEQIRNHTFKKYYLAVVNGTPKNNDTLVNYLIKDKKNNLVSVVSKETPNAKRAELSYELKKVHENLSLVDIELKTGRPHQIRVQFANIKHPLVGDIKYGDHHKAKPIALYAYKIEFAHPVTKEPLTFTLEPNQVHPFNLF